MRTTIYDRMVQLGVKPHSLQEPVYKYRSIQSAIEILITNQIYFPSARELEPWDRLELHKSILDLSYSENAKARHLEYLTLGNCTDEYYRERILPDSIEYMRTHVGLFSVGKSPNNGPLWERYGNQHKGVCLGFVIPQNAYSSNLSFNINYSKNPVKVRLIDEEDGNISNDIFYWFCTKQERYSYEEEVRIIDENFCGFKPFKKEMLFEIVLGMDTTERDYNLISKVATDYGYNVKISKIVVDDNDYELKVVEAKSVY